MQRYGYLYLFPINVFVESGRSSDGSSRFQNWNNIR